MPHYAIRVLWLGFALLLEPSVPYAQQAALRMGKAPYYANAPIVIQVVLEGFEEDPQPKVTAPSLTQGRLKFQGVSPSVSSSIQIINNQIKRFKTVRFTYQYQFTATALGSYTLDPFTVSQGKITRYTKTITIKIEEIPLSDKMQIHLDLPTTIYLGQRVQVPIEWWFNSSLQGKLFNHRLHIPMFDRSEFRWSDAKPPPSQIALHIDTPAGIMEYPAQEKNQHQNGKTVTIRSTQRWLHPLQAGAFQIKPASVVADEATRWSHGIFGTRTPTHARKLRAIDTPRTLLVKSLPQAGRPASFSGTVGRGYRLTASVDQSVVQVGDPIRLTLTLQGDAAIIDASLPPLVAAGLPPQSFRAPSREISGMVTANEKRFELRVRVLEESVHEIPPLSFSWFDPSREQYETVQSKPIALAVRAAHVVSAQDVIRHTSPSEPAEHQPALPKPSRSQNQPTFSLHGADLAIERDSNKLLGDSVWYTQLWVQACAYIASLLLLGLAILARRQANMDPEITARKKRMRSFTLNLSTATSIENISVALRGMAALATQLPRNELDALLAECDEQVYAPEQSQGTQAMEGLQTKALHLAHRMLAEN